MCIVKNRSLLTIKEGRAMANAVKENKIVFQTGSQQRTNTEVNFAAPWK